MRRLCNLRLVLAYDGTGYAGWQKQKNALSLQEVFEKTAEKVLGHPVAVAAAGRTDAGVHAKGQCINFYSRTPIPPEKLKWILNQKLPRAVKVVRAAKAPMRFHATYHAEWKIYRYVIRNHPEPSPFDRFFHHWEARPLDLPAMSAAARVLLGRHDFSAFCGPLGRDRNPNRTLRFIRVCRRGAEVHVDVEGDSFLHHMVRILAGTLLYVGLGKWKHKDVQEALQSRDRRKAGPTLPAKGLFLMKVRYRKVLEPVPEGKIPPEPPA